MMYSPPTISRSNREPVNTAPEAPPKVSKTTKKGDHIETIQLKSSTITISRKGIEEIQTPKTVSPKTSLSTRRINSNNTLVVDKNTSKAQSGPPLDASQRLALQEAVRCAGQRILFFAFDLLFKGDVNNMKKCFKDAGFSNNMYKDTFNNAERMKLNKGVAGSWNMPLLYKVLQRVCGLSSPEDSCWTKHKAGVDGESIEYLMFSTKEICARVIHSNDAITQHDVKTQLADLQSVFTKINRRFMTRNKERQKELEELRNFFEETLIDFLPKKEAKSIYKIY